MESQALNAMGVVNDVTINRGRVACDFGESED